MCKNSTYMISKPERSFLFKGLCVFGKWLARVLHVQSDDCELRHHLAEIICWYTQIKWLWLWEVQWQWVILVGEASRHPNQWWINAMRQIIVFVDRLLPLGGGVGRKWHDLWCMLCNVELVDRCRWMWKWQKTVYKWMLEVFRIALDIEHPTCHQSKTQKEMKT